MARKRSAPRRKAPRKNYSWYQIRYTDIKFFPRSGKQPVLCTQNKLMPPAVLEFIEAHRHPKYDEDDPSTSMWKNRIEASVMPGLRAVCDRLPQNERGFTLDVVSPVGEVVYRFSEVVSWESSIQPISMQVDKRAPDEEYYELAKLNEQAERYHGLR